MLLPLLMNLDAMVLAVTAPVASEIPPVVVSDPAPAEVAVGSPDIPDVEVPEPGALEVTVSDPPVQAVTVPDVDPLPTLVTNTPGGTSVEPLNLVMWMIDDASRSLMEFHSDTNRWPAGFRYADLGFLSDIRTNQAIRFTNFRVNARCSPTRISMFTGRLAHISLPQPSVNHPGHLHGTGIGDVQKQTPDPPVDGDWWLGMQPQHRSWAEVARLAGIPHGMAFFGKYHLFPQARVNVGTPQVTTIDLNQRAIVEIAGFDRSVYVKQTGSGEPFYGYKNWPYEITEPNPNDDVAGNGRGTFSPGWLYDRMVEYIDDQFAMGKPIVLNVWNNLPHGLPAAIDPLENQWNEAMHTFTHDELVPNVGGSDPFAGTVDPGHPGYGHDATGVFNGTGEYTSQGRVPVFHIRVTALLEVMDFYTQKLHDYIINHPTGMGARTTFMHMSDNGSDPLAITPIDTTQFSHLGGVEFSNCYPPTVDGTVTGARFHDEDDAKGSIKDEGILSHLLVWGSSVNPALQGMDCNALIGALDWPNTVLDLLAPGQWQSWYGADYARLEGESFAKRFQDGGIGTREYTFHSVQKPGWVADETVEVTQFDRCVVWDNGTVRYKFRSLYEKDVITKDYFLYDLIADPAETTDLIAGNTDPGIAAIILQLSAVYFEKFGLV